MSERKKISTEKYILAAIFTALIFGLGLTLGFIFNNERVKWMQDVKNQQDIDYSSLQLQYLYLTGLKESGESCAVLQNALETSVSDLAYSLERFQEYKKGDTGINDQLKSIERRYILDNFKYWLFAKKAKDDCENIDLVNILYFYSENGCSICPSQGVVLTYYKKKFGENVLVFPINVDLEKNERMITIIKSRYNITSYPSIVVGDETYKGIMDKDELGKIICGSFKKERPECSEK